MAHDTAKYTAGIGFRYAWLSAVMFLNPPSVLADCQSTTQLMDGGQADIPIVLDDFDCKSNWVAEPSEGVDASVHLAVDGGLTGGALRLDYDFKGGSGYAKARKAIRMELPEDYRFSLQIKGQGTVNKLEIKLIDETGENVWWKTYEKFEFEQDWQKVDVSRRQIQFAWGPTEDKLLRRAAFIEVVVVAREARGKGSVFIDDLTFQRREPQPDSWNAPEVTASSVRSHQMLPKYAVDGNTNTAWQSKVGGAQTLTMNFGRVREFGAVALYWEKDSHPTDYDLAYSNDGQTWHVQRTVVSRGGREILYLKNSEAQFVQLRMHGTEGENYGLQEIEIKAAIFGDSLNDFIQGLAQESPRGTFPRTLSGEQGYWTIVGLDGGADNGLLSEDGAVEVGRGQFSLEPFVLADDNLATWADIPDIGHSLLAGYYPIPSVHWALNDWSLTITALASDDSDREELITRYKVTNHSPEAQEITLAIAVRPFQVNSPKQVLNTPGGVSPISHVNWDGNSLSVNGKRWIQPLIKPDKVIMGTVGSAPAPEMLRQGEESFAIESAITDATGLASALLLYDLNLAPSAEQSVVIVAPLADNQRQSDYSTIGSPLQMEEWFAERQTRERIYWHEKLNRVEIQVPEEGHRIVDTLRSSLAHILISRNGVNLRPGTRNYGHSWIRDGAMIAEGLLRMGITDLPSEYVQWFAPFQFENGKVPCCVTQHDTADPVPENDSHGELIFLIAEIYRFTDNKGLVQKLWPHVQGAINYMDKMRHNEQRLENQSGDRRMLYGLLEPSISHEGYSSPAYSNWDNFWGLKGYNDAVELAEVMGYTDDVSRFTASRDEFRRDLFNSLRASANAHGIDYIAGAAELGDFDATSTTIALAPGGEKSNLPQDLLLGTFERYWRMFVGRRDGSVEWDVYTPYELRQISTFVRLGWRSRAHDLLDFFFADRRPEEWNQWAEVVGRDKRQPRFIGDMPHAWISSDYIRSALDLFAYRRFSDQSLVLAAGIPGDWIKSSGVGVERLGTAYGELSYTLKASDNDLSLDVSLSGEKFPRGGIILPWPFESGSPKSTTLNGETVQWSNGELKIGAPLSRVVVSVQFP